LKFLGLEMEVGLWETVGMKPRRPAVKDSTKNLRSEGAKRRSQQVAAKAARKAAAKKARMEEDFNQAAFRVVQESTKDRA
jgi:hypothetical protein